MPEEFSVERRNHPWGEQGVRSSLDEVAKRATEGAVRPEVRTWAIECLDKARKQGKRVSSDKGRAETILKACQDKLWVPDPVFAEYIPPARLLACAKHGDNGSICIKGDDCFVAGTLMLTSNFELKPVESLQEGDRIWGLDDWSTVKRVWYKGVLPVDVIKLNNGSELKLTADHHVYILECRKHPKEIDGCSCLLECRTEQRIKVSELRRGAVLPTPQGKARDKAKLKVHEKQGWRVGSIDREVISLPCWDITTSDHRVYLPEHDVTVSQCDGLVTLCAGAFMSVGLHTLVVGHGYGSHRTIQHVLTAVRIGDKWYYADPSTPETRSALPLGECIPFTRERLIAMPNLKVICDDNVCLTNDGAGFDPNAMQFVDQGVFIGINGAPREVRGLPFGKRLRWLGRGEGRATRILTKQGLEQDGGSTRKLTATDKIALAGVLLSAAALAYQFSRE